MKSAATAASVVAMAPAAAVNAGQEQLLPFAKVVVAAVKMQAEAGAALRTDLSRLSAAYAALRAKRDALLSDLEAAQRRRAHAEMDNKALRSAVAALNHKRAALAHENAKVREELDRLKQQLEADASAQGPGIFELRAVNLKLREAVGARDAQLEAAKSAVESEATAAKARLEAVEAEAGDARAKLAAAEAKNARLESQLQQFRAAMTNLQRRIAIKSQQRRARAGGDDQVAGGSDVAKQRLMAFFERTFSCTGDTEVLRLALGEFCDEEATRCTSSAETPTRNSSQFTPKPLLLIHRISEADVGLESAPVQATPATETPSVADEADCVEVKEDLAGGGENASSTPLEQGVIDLTREQHMSEPAPSSAPTASATEPEVQRDHGGGCDTSEAQREALAVVPAKHTPAKRSHSEVSSSESEPSNALVVVTNNVAEASRPSSASSRPAKKRTTPTAGGETSNPSSLMDADGDITEADMRGLYKTKPWEAMFDQRPLFSHVLNPRKLSQEALVWVNRALAFRYHFCQELWEQRHWILVPLGARSKELHQMMEERVRRHERAQTAWNELRSTAEELIGNGQLNGDVWLDPFLWLPPTNPLTWSPSTHDLVTELGALDSKQPERCFYVNDIARHPFYTNRLCEKYHTKTPLTHK